MDDAQVPTERTLMEVLAELTERSFGADMFVTEDARVRCGTCHQDTAAPDLDLDRLVRLEGASDPADMAAVLGLTCRHCGTKGSASSASAPARPPGRRGPRRPRGPPLLTPPQRVPVAQREAVRGAQVAGCDSSVCGRCLNPQVAPVGQREAV